MKRGIMLLALALLVSSPFHLADAQQPKKVPRIGFLAVSGDPNTPGPWVGAFRQGLRDLGYTEGKNVLVEYRYVGGKLNRIPSLVGELVRLEVYVLVVVAPAAIRRDK